MRPAHRTAVPSSPPKKKSPGGLTKALVASTALGVAAVMVLPSAANAAPVVSQANGRLVETSLLSSSLLDQLVSLKGAQATNADGSHDVTSDTPLDANLLSGLAGVKAGTTDLFGGNGIIQLGGVGQYAAANNDGSSAAFSGAVSQAPSLVGVSTVTPSNLGAPSADSTAELKLDTAQLLGGTDLVRLDVTLGALAASAKEATDGTQTGQYTLADAGVTVGGTLISPVLSSLRTPIETLLTTVSLLGVSGITDPISSDGTLQLSLQDLLDAAGVTSVNQLPAGTNLLTYVPKAVTTKLTTVVDGVLTAVSNASNSALVTTAVNTAKGVVNPILSGLTSSLNGPLGSAVNALAQLDLGVQAHNPDGSFSETALQLGLGANGAIAQVPLANATVGPNAGPVAVPIVNAQSAGIAGGVGLVGGAIVLAFWLRRRRVADAVRAQ